MADLRFAESVAGKVFPLAGEYRLVAQRRAEGVAGPLEPEQDSTGASISFGEVLRLPDGRACPLRPTPIAGTSIYLGDANLSDLILGPLAGRPDHRLNESFLIPCPQTNTVVSIVAIDASVVVLPSEDGIRYDIFALSRPVEVIQRVQSNLAYQGLYQGEITGVMDAPTNQSLAAYAERRGAAYRFANPVMTLNLLDGLGAFD